MQEGIKNILIGNKITIQHSVVNSQKLIKLLKKQLI